MSVIDIHLAGIENADNPESHNVHIVWRYPHPDGEREIAICRMIYNARIIVTEDINVDAGWCYGHVSTAALFAAKWIEGGCEGEPEGWVKNLQTGEWRP